MLFVQLSSIGYSPLYSYTYFFKYHYTIHRRTYVLYKIKNRHSFITKPCLFFLLLNFFFHYSISLFLIFPKNISIRFTASLIFCKELE